MLAVDSRDEKSNWSEWLTGIRREREKSMCVFPFSLCAKQTPINRTVKRRYLHLVSSSFLSFFFFFLFLPSFLPSATYSSSGSIDTAYLDLWLLLWLFPCEQAACARPVCIWEACVCGSFASLALWVSVLSTFCHPHWEMRQNEWLRREPARSRTTGRSFRYSWHARTYTEYWEVRTVLSFLLLYMSSSAQCTVHSVLGVQQQWPNTSTRTEWVFKVTGYKEGTSYRRLEKARNQLVLLLGRLLPLAHRQVKATAGWSWKALQR